ncbi:hypothetical protein IGI04_021252 [Brassica rapa subsp. trilocularis]|uniref:Uncharacterized protein n=1 Tax=Brassica rapa subsp. trilocularis TaxID=1813537 RepID=A0ABQ7ML19_BRACM|nr:hypothetical protein IGI04_021252 [Brassica rapa subsp. trilocularis]
MDTCGALVKSLSLSLSLSLSRTKHICFSLSFSSTKPRLSTSPRRFRRCFPFSHRSVGVVGICVGGKLVSVSGVADRVVFERRRRVSLAFLHHTASLSSSLLGDSQRLPRWLNLSLHDCGLITLFLFSST